MHTIKETACFKKEGDSFMKDKKLYRSNKNRILCGVCGGIGEYSGIDPTLILLICLILCVISIGGGILVYLIGAIIMPKDPD